MKSHITLEEELVSPNLAKAEDIGEVYPDFLNP